MSFITPNTWFTNISNTKLRKYIINNTSITEIVDYSNHKVFLDAVVMTAIIVFRKSNINDKIKIFIGNETLIFLQEIKQSLFKENDNSVFNIRLTETDVAIKKKMLNESSRLEDVALVKFGVKIYEVGKGNPPQSKEDTKNRIYESNHKIDETYKPYLEGKDVNSNLINWNNKWLKYGENLAAPRNKELFESERILVRRIMGRKIICSYIDKEIISNALLQIVKPFEQNISKSLSQILGSKLIAYYFKKSSDRQDKVFPEIKIHELKSLPIIVPKNEIKSSLEEKAETMLSLNESLNKQKNQFLKLLQSNFEIEKLSKKLQSFYDHDFKTLVSELKKKKVSFNLAQQAEWMEFFEQSKAAINELQNKITSTDSEIDKMVYDLYGLTDEEIQIVEGAV